MTDHIDPSKGGNTMKGILYLLITMTESAKGFNDLPRWIGYVGSGIFGDFFDVRTHYGMSCFVPEHTFTHLQAIDEFGPQSQWEFYQLEKDIEQATDYLSCMMTALINEAVYNMESYISGQALPAYSATINAMTSSVGDQCGRLNCMLLLSCVAYQHLLASTQALTTHCFHHQSDRNMHMTIV